MNARRFRAMADRCRELLRVAVRHDIREQLRQWAADLEAVAKAAEKKRQRTPLREWRGSRIAG